MHSIHMYVHLYSCICIKTLHKIIHKMCSCLSTYYTSIYGAATANFYRDKTLCAAVVIIYIYIYIYPSTINTRAKSNAVHSSTTFLSHIIYIYMYEYKETCLNEHLPWVNTSMFWTNLFKNTAVLCTNDPPLSKHLQFWTWTHFLQDVQSGEVWETIENGGLRTGSV